MRRPGSDSDTVTEAAAQALPASDSLPVPRWAPSRSDLRPLPVPRRRPLPVGFAGPDIGYGAAGHRRSRSRSATVLPVSESHWQAGPGFKPAFTLNSVAVSDSDSRPPGRSAAACGQWFKFAISLTVTVRVTESPLSHHHSISGPSLAVQWPGHWHGPPAPAGVTVVRVRIVLSGPSENFKLGPSPGGLTDSEFDSARVRRRRVMP